MIYNKNVKRGEIYWVNLGEREGSIQSGIRPALIIFNDINNKFSPTVNILPITSKRKPLPVHVKVGRKEGLSKTSYVLTEQETTINKNQVKDMVGICNKRLLLKVEEAIMLQKGINLEEHIEEYV